jgi:hypothetical protein
LTAQFTLFASLTDEELIDQVTAMVRQERRATALLVAALAELDRRKLYLPLGCPSLFAYCTRVLHLAEHAAYNRIEAARVASRFPVILDRLHDGSLTLASIRLLAPILTSDNHSRLLEVARHKTKREVELLVAAENPQPDAATVVRRLPAREIAPSASAETRQTDKAHEPPPRPVEDAGASTLAASQPQRQATATPLTPERYKIQFTAPREFHDKFRRAQALLRHAVPNGDAAAIFERALDLLLADVEKRKHGATERPRAARTARDGSRHIPSAVKREVWKRDGGRCAFVGIAGRCAEEAFLEFHHVVPFAAGGPATTANIELRCRAHNAYESDQLNRLLCAGDES